ncbi:MAG TPA: hypothetical protein PKD85_03825 [Saprospiraceae bacterium]|nr:hypothetical protein [Saprospiraceae bacterium]
MSTVIYEQFAECKKFTLDSYWIDQFQNFAQNKFPPGVRYDSTRNSLILRLDGKKNEVLALPTNPEKLFSVMMNVMKDMLNLRSTRDLKIEKKEMDKIIEQRVCDTDCDWKQLKPRNLKDQLIMEYISYLKEYYSLDPIETRNLIAVIQIGFKFRYISQDDVKYKKGKVRHIKGLKFNTKKRIFESSYKPGNQNTTRNVKPVPNKFYNEVDKYIKSHMTRMTKYKL